MQRYSPHGWGVTQKACTIHLLVCRRMAKIFEYTMPRMWVRNRSQRGDGAKELLIRFKTRFRKKQRHAQHSAAVVTLYKTLLGAAKVEARAIDKELGKVQEQRKTKQGRSATRRRSGSTTAAKPSSSSSSVSSASSSGGDSQDTGEPGGGSTHTRWALGAGPAAKVIPTLNTGARTAPAGGRGLGGLVGRWEEAGVWFGG